MTSADVLVDGYDRIREAVHDATRKLSEDDLALRLDPQANSIAWLIWHLTRVQDDHLAGAAGTEQVWFTQGWRDRFDLPFDDLDIGYGHSSEQVAQVRAEAELLLGYHDSVHEQTVTYVARLSDTDLDEIIDPDWTPPVTRGVRLVSVLADGLQHAGQAAFIRGIAERR
ncbi:DUF664 domain-containing protein [Saccharopolyspora sp. NFXS83]|uniref:mycothiol transferase n=1 Tax=Saccharopolyspora sp. NFXS83 TaxID=2993560 RepID=UPI00224AEBD0|nr:DUF664 domain-containing protein [Saccharopolyspora sp. NFXS83]MCX2734483.1 DUF664 domain-containing protein [Saccharopolyspora sp. NFXS83]